MIKTRHIILVTVVVILVMPVFVLAGTVELPQTGQTACYDSSGAAIVCSGTGQDGDSRQVCHGPARGLRSARMVTVSQITLQV